MGIGGDCLFQRLFVVVVATVLLCIGWYVEDEYQSIIRGCYIICLAVIFLTQMDHLYVTQMDEGMMYSTIHDTYHLISWYMYYQNSNINR